MDRAREFDDLASTSLLHLVKGSGAPLLRSLTMLFGLGWSLAFIVIGCGFGLQMYGDGSIFSYAIAAEQAWDFHWHNISGRVFVFLIAHWPAEFFVHLTGDAPAGIILHGLLFFTVPFVGLCATWSADQSERRSFLLHACASTAVVCPLVFGFPTEMWVAHAVFWPTLALAHHPHQSVKRAGLFAVGMTALMLSHGGGVVFAGLIVTSTLMRRPERPERPVGHRTWICSGIAAFIWAIVLVLFRPDPYIAKVIGTAAYSFINPRNLIDPVVGVIIVATSGYVCAMWLFSRILRCPSPRVSALLSVLLALVIYYRYFDVSLLADARYPLRTALLVFPPVLAASALLSINEIGYHYTYIDRIAAQTRRYLKADHLAAALVLTTTVHAVETAKFVHAWSEYKSSLTTLAMGKDPGSASKPPQFVSSEKISDSLNRVAWSSTTHFLSILVAPGLSPSRMVISPYPAYWWLSCRTATDSLQRSTAVPIASREFIRTYACSH